MIDTKSITTVSFCLRHIFFGNFSVLYIEVIYIITNTNLSICLSTFVTTLFISTSFCNQDKKNNRQPIIKIRKAPLIRKYFLTSLGSIPFLFIPSHLSLQIHPMALHENDTTSKLKNIIVLFIIP